MGVGVAYFLLALWLNVYHLGMKHNFNFIEVTVHQNEDTALHKKPFYTTIHIKLRQYSVGLIPPEKKDPA
jgi:hypothetical protein